MDGLVIDLIHEISLCLPLSDIRNLSLCSKRYRKNIIDSEIFWKRKFFQDFKILIQDNRTWKQKYQQFGNVKYVFSDKSVSWEYRLNYRWNIRIKAQHVIYSEFLFFYILIDFNNSVWKFNGDNMKPTPLFGIDNLFKAKSMSSTCTYILFIDMKNYLWKYSPNSFEQISNIGFQQISSGENHSICIDINNNVWTFGSNNCGQCGLGDTLDRKYLTLIPNIKAKQVSAGYVHTVLIDMENNVWSFGSNLNGPLGFPYNEDDIEDDFIGDQKYIPMCIPNIKAKRISSGYDYTLCIDMDNNVWAFGANNNGELGLKNYHIRWIPEQIPNIKAQQIFAGDSHSCILDMNNNIWSCGWYHYVHDTPINSHINDKICEPQQIMNFKVKQVCINKNSMMIIQY